MGGRKIELVIVDAQSRPEAAASGVDTLVQAGACAFTGATASALGLASSQAAAKYNLAQVFSHWHGGNRRIPWPAERVPLHAGCEQVHERCA